MNADQVRAIVAAKYPQAMTSPVAVLVKAIVAVDEADRAIEFAQIQAHRDAVLHAMQCIHICDAQGIRYDVDTLSFNIESNFPYLSLDDCDSAAHEAFRQTKK